LLNNVFSVFANPCVAKRERKNFSPMALDKRFKCFFITIFGSGHQILVRGRTREFNGICAHFVICWHNVWRIFFPFVVGPTSSVYSFLLADSAFRCEAANCRSTPSDGFGRSAVDLRVMPFRMWTSLPPRLKETSSIINFMR